MHIVITGASRGIGRALARRLSLKPGARLTLVARNEALLRRLARELDCPTRIVAADLSNPKQMTNWLAAAEEEFGSTNMLVNNAGMQVVGSTATLDVEQGERSLALNLAAPLRLIRKVLPRMKRSGVGTIVNIASVAALAPTPAMAYYNASKSGLAAASEALNGELRGSGIRVLTVYPGIIADTDMAQAGLQAYQSSLMLRLQPTKTAAGLATEIDRSLERNRARLVYPRSYGLVRWFSPLVRWVMDRFAPPLATPKTQSSLSTATRTSSAQRATSK